MSTDSGDGSAATMSIGTFARRSRLSAGALRLYDREGLLVPAHVDAFSGYRRYREEQLEAARLISLLRRLDMSLPEVGAVLAAPTDKAAVLVATHWARLEQRAAAQRELARHIRETIFGENRSAMHEVRQRQVPEQTLLSVQRHVPLRELEGFIQQTATHLMELAEVHGAARGQIMVIYHGEVTEDSDGPLEVAQPVDPDLAARAKLLTRIEPAHQEAYVRLITAQVVYPTILSAYDAVFAWVSRQGRSTAGSPREVYLGYFPTAGPEDEICDVALPYL